MSVRLLVTLCPTRVIVNIIDRSAITSHSIYHKIRSVCKSLHSWERDGKKWVMGADFYLADDDKLEVIVPTYFYASTLKPFMDLLSGCNISETIVKLSPEKRGFELKDSCVDKPEQIVVLDFLRQRKGMRSVIEGDTGFGKTYCALRIGAIYGEPVLVLAPSLTTRWMDEARALLKPECMEDVFEIAGADSIKKLYASGKRPTLIISSPATLQYYVAYKDNYREVPRFDQFIRDFGIGTKIVDETHSAFVRTSSVDLAGDVRTNIYLSATMVQNNPSIDGIFQRWLPEHIRYVTDLQNPHTINIQYEYCQLVGKHKCKMHGMYSQVMYEKALCSNGYKALDYLIVRDLIPVLNEYFVKKRSSGQRCLIFMNNSATILHTLKKLKARYGEAWDIRSYVGDDNEDNLYEADICISTISGSGQGKDIKGLKTIINFVSHASKIQTIQVRGRLRPIEGEDTYMVDMYSEKIEPMQKHLSERTHLLRGRLKSVVMVRGPMT